MNMSMSEFRHESGAAVGRIVAALAVTIVVVLGVYTFVQTPEGEEEAQVDTGPLEQADAKASDTLEIVVNLVEFAFSPDPIRIPAGRPVKLVVRNTGVVPHEIMIGREVEDGTFEHDLFAGVPVRIEGAGTSMDMPMGMMGGSAVRDDHAAQETEDAEAASHPHEDGDEAHEDSSTQEGHEQGGHGTMALVQPGETATMTFTIPADKRGEWTAACFLPGHYEAGMSVDLVVE